MSNILQRIENALRQWESSCTIRPCYIFLGDEEIFALDAFLGMIVIEFREMMVVHVERNSFLGLGI